MFDHNGDHMRFLRFGSYINSAPAKVIFPLSPELFSLSIAYQILSDCQMRIKSYACCIFVLSLRLFSIIIIIVPI